MISYPLSLPTVLGPNSVSFKPMHSTAISRSPFSFASQAQSWGGQRLSATVSLPPMKRDVAEKWITFILSLKGTYGTFLMGDPNGKVPLGLATGSPVVNTSNAVGSSTLNIRGATPNVNDWLKAGDYIQVSSGLSARLYKVLADANSNFEGGTTVDIWPNLRATYADGTTIEVRDTVGLFRLSGNDYGWDINEVSSYGMSFDCEEVV